MDLREIEGLFFPAFAGMTSVLNFYLLTFDVHAKAQRRNPEASGYVKGVASFGRLRMTTQFFCHGFNRLG